MYYTGLQNKGAHDKNIKKLIKFNVRDLVLVRSNFKSDKLNKKISKFYTLFLGPYVIREKISFDTYVIANENIDVGQFHVSHLKPYHV